MTNEHIIINSDRSVTIPASAKTIGVQYDHNVETLVFDCPRYWNGLDMSTMRVYINYVLPDGTLGAYIADDVAVDEQDDTIMHFSWTVTRNVTRQNGTITFLVCIKNVDGEGNETNHWNSALIKKQLIISEGLECVEPIQDSPDFISLILLKVDAASRSEINAKTSETNAKESETNAKTSETNAKESEENAKTSEENAAKSAESIPNMQQQVDELKGDLSDLNDKLYDDIYSTGNPLMVTSESIQRVKVTTESEKIHRFGKNLLYLAREKVITSNPSSDTTIRDFSEPAIWVGLGNKNYFNNAKVESYSIDGDTISVTNNNLLGYGIAMNIPIVPGSKICISFVNVETAVIKAGFYKNGEYVSGAIYNSANQGKFTVPETSNQMIICIEPSETYSTGIVKGLQIEYADTATEYTDPVEMVEYPVVGGIANVDLICGVTTLIAESEITVTQKSDRVRNTVDLEEARNIAGNVADEKLIDYAKKTDLLNSWYRGKKIATFGDSITNMNMWQPFMAEYLGCTYTRHGIGGGTVAKTSNTEHQDDCMYMDARIDVIESDADVILVFGGHNDWSNRVPIGSIPTDNTFSLSDDGAVDTFVYAYALMIKKLVSRFPQAKIFTMSCVGGRHDSRYPERDDGHYYIGGLSMEDYADAVKMVSAYYGIPCIDLSSLSGISTLNHGTYLADEIHPNSEGGKLIAERVCRELLRFEPIVYTSAYDDIRLQYDVTNK